MLCEENGFYRVRHSFSTAFTSAIGILLSSNSHTFACLTLTYSLWFLHLVASEDEFDDMSKPLLPPPSPASAAFRPQVEKAPHRIMLCPLAYHTFQAQWSKWSCRVSNTLLSLAVCAAPWERLLRHFRLKCSICFHDLRAFSISVSIRTSTSFVAYHATLCLL